LPKLFEAVAPLAGTYFGFLPAEKASPGRKSQIFSREGSLRGEHVEIQQPPPGELFFQSYADPFNLFRGRELSSEEQDLPRPVLAENPASLPQRGDALEKDFFRGLQTHPIPRKLFGKPREIERELQYPGIHAKKLLLKIPPGFPSLQKEEEILFIFWRNLGIRHATHDPFPPKACEVFQRIPQSPFAPPG
jgi:hypothetical protein